MEIVRKTEIVNGRVNNTFEYAYAYIYTVSMASIAVATNATPVTLKTHKQYDFVLSKITLHEINAASAYTTSTFAIPLIRYNIQNKNTGEFLFSKQVQAVCVSGFGMMPFNLPAPIRFEPNTKLEFTAYNMELGPAAAATAPQFCLHGYIASKEPF